jgi:hypothetical protein
MAEETLVITDPDSDRYHTFGYISWWKQEVVRNATVLVVGAGAPFDPGIAAGAKWMPPPSASRS